MNSINSFIENVSSSRKRTGILYCSGQFDSVVWSFNQYIHDLQIFDCATLYNGTLIFSASDLLNQIELELKNKTALVTNLETFIAPNSLNFSEQLAKLLTVREPLKPLFFLFYSRKVYTQFKNQYEVKELNQFNTIEL